MLKWSFIFLVIALIAGLLGFTTIAGTSIAIAKILFFVLLIVFIVMLVLGSAAVKGIKNTIQK